MLALVNLMTSCHVSGQYCFIKSNQWCWGLSMIQVFFGLANWISCLMTPFPLSKLKMANCIDSCKFKVFYRRYTGLGRDKMCETWSVVPLMTRIGTLNPVKMIQQAPRWQSKSIETESESTNSFSITHWPFYQAQKIYFCFRNYTRTRSWYHFPRLTSSVPRRLSIIRPGLCSQSDCPFTWYSRSVLVVASEGSGGGWVGYVKVNYLPPTSHPLITHCY